MSKNDNAHSIRLVNSLEKNIGSDIAKEFEEKYPLSKSANIEKKYEWAKNVCSYLEQNFDTETVIKIRKECRCNDGKSIANKMLKYLKKADSIENFVNQFNTNETFANLIYISENKVLFCYPECYCSCVKRIPREVLKKDVKVTLLESIKSGADKCVIEVEW